MACEREIAQDLMHNDCRIWYEAQAYIGDCPHGLWTTELKSMAMGDCIAACKRLRKKYIYVRLVRTTSKVLNWKE